MGINNNELKDRYASLPDTILFDLYSKKEDLTEIALSILKCEIEKRGLDLNKTDQFFPGNDLNANALSPGKQRQTVEEICSQYNAGSLLWWRALATMIDFIVLMVITVLILIISTWMRIGEPILPVILGSVFIAYYIYFEWKFGKTIGKFIVKIRVVTQKGTGLTLMQTLIRTAFRVLEVNPGLAGGAPAAIVMSLNKRKQRIGDLIAKTYIIRDVDLANGSSDPNCDDLKFIAS